MFCKKGVLKNFAIFTGKHLCWSLFADLQVCNFIKKKLQCWCCEIFKNTYSEEHLRTTASYFMKKNRHSWRLNNSSKKILNQWISVNLQFYKMICLQKKVQRKCMQIIFNIIKYQVQNCPALPGRNLISTCNCRVKSVSAGRVEVSSRQAGIM